MNDDRLIVPVTVTFISASITSPHGDTARGSRYFQTTLPPALYHKDAAWVIETQILPEIYGDEGRKVESLSVSAEGYGFTSPIAQNERPVPDEPSKPWRITVDLTDCYDLG